MHFLLKLLIVFFQVGCSSLSPIDQAIQDGDSSSVSKFIENNEDINIVNEMGFAPLHFAVANNKLEIIKALFMAGADIDVRDKDNLTPLLYSCQLGKEEAVILLIELGANKYLKSKSGENCIYLAASYKHPKVTKLLLENGLSPNSKRNDNLTALHAAAESADIESVKLLLKYGAEINASGLMNQIPLDLAVKKNNHEVVTILLQAGAKPHLIENNKFPFSSAISAREFYLAASYYENNNDINTSIEYYKTAAEQFDILSKELDIKSTKIRNDAISNFAFDWLIAFGTAVAGNPHTIFRTPGLFAQISNSSDVRDFAEAAKKQSKFCRDKIIELEAILMRQSEETSILQP